MTNAPFWMSDLKPHNQKISTADAGKFMMSSQYGRKCLWESVNGDFNDVTLDDCAIVPDCEENLFSVAAADRQGA
jgi:hypothetical protein